MRAAANFAWANRQVIAHRVRKAFESVYGESWQSLGMDQVYDVSHNMAKIEMHDVDGETMEVCVHRKGATRAFPPGHPSLPPRYREIGQPVLIPGDMGRASYIAVGGTLAMERSFGSTCHGAGRLRSRGEAKRMLRGHDVRSELMERGVVVRAHGAGLLAEEAPLAYKDVTEVVAVADGAGLSKKVARLRPLGVVKG
jgi:tRNA-splicing ligase RtcB